MNATTNSELAAVAELLAGLLLHELDGPRLAELQQEELATALEALGLQVRGLDPERDLDELAVEFLEAFVQPAEGGPLVQSLWTGGTYEGEPAVIVRKLAQVAGVEFDRAAARGAAHDHLGCILLLWAATQESAPEVAERLREEHLRWALPPLARLARGKGFYPQLCACVARFIDELL